MENSIKIADSSDNPACGHSYKLFPMSAKGWTRDWSICPQCAVYVEFPSGVSFGGPVDVARFTIGPIGASYDLGTLKPSTFSSRCLPTNGFLGATPLVYSVTLGAERDHK